MGTASLFHATNTEKKPEFYETTCCIKSRKLSICCKISTKPANKKDFLHVRVYTLYQSS